jgi:hypothetical protein
MSLKPIPKSLHTVTVLVKMALMFIERGAADPVGLALDTLGYDEFGQDIYGLAEQARKQLKAMAK